MTDGNRARNWLARAEELRAVAEQMQLAETRMQLLKLAGDLERMAERAESGLVPAPSDEARGSRPGPRRRSFLTPT